jgi:hypothetical protein
MYRVFRASTLYYEKNMRGVRGRYDLIKPYVLLTDTSLFNASKNSNSYEYIELIAIIKKMKELLDTGKDEYHHFDMLLKEFEILGFKIDSLNHYRNKKIDEERTKEQISLLLQFLSFRYPFDEYDNKTGVHNIIQNKFIFIQP